MTTEIRLTLPIPPSTNQLYAGKERRFKSTEYKEWIKEANIALLKQPKYSIEGDKWLQIDLTFYTPLYNRVNKKKKRWDLDNHQKALLDFLDDHIEGLDDRKYILSRAEKIDSDRGEVEIVISEIGDNGAKQSL